MRKGFPIAILCSDLHLSHVPPACRLEKDSWYETQGRYLAQIRTASEKHNRAVIIYAGDIFDKPNPPIELINWTLMNLPRGYAIPGQHDLMHHEMQDIHKTAYGTLCRANVITNLHDQMIHIHKGAIELLMVGYPWRSRYDRKPFMRSAYDDAVRLAVCHRFVWSKRSNSYEGASGNDNVKCLPVALSPFDAILFGDNHKGFLYEHNHQTVLNCGTMMRRKIDEANYRPGYGVLYSDRTIERKYYDCSEDKITTKEVKFDKDDVMDLEQFMKELGALSKGSLDFRNAVTSFLNNNDISNRVRNFILRSLEQ